MKKLIRLWFIFFVFLAAVGCSEEAAREVVIYTSVDQIFSEPILSDFEKNTGIKVKAVYDVEAMTCSGTPK